MTVKTIRSKRLFGSSLLATALVGFILGVVPSMLGLAGCSDNPTCCSCEAIARNCSGGVASKNVSASETRPNGFGQSCEEACREIDCADCSSCELTAVSECSQ